MALLDSKCVIIFLSMVTILSVIMNNNNNNVSASNVQHNDDILCLKSIKASLEDPHNSLQSWRFHDTTSLGFICKFIGVVCWNDLENRVLGLELVSLGLQGKFPSGISKCTSLQVLNLSNNNLYGSIPTNMSIMLPFLVRVSLSSNNFSGEIPASLGNCTYLNDLELDHNRFSGRIPAGIGRLTRLRKFSVANNLLVGPIPHFVSGVNFNVSSFANNTRLCGYPLKPCTY